jgi:hypothetical protein
MHVVVITELGCAIEVEAAALASLFGTTAYEERLALAAGLPAVVRVAEDRDHAQAVLRSVLSRGSRAVAFSRDDVVDSGAMIAMRQFTLEGSVITTDRASLRIADIGAIVRANHKQRTVTQTTTSKKQFDMGRALVTGGLIMRKSVTSEKTDVSVEDEQVVYIFPANGGVPWLLRERGTGYAGLGKHLAPSAMQNFQTMIRLLREGAPTARFDDRLARPRGFGKSAVLLAFDNGSNAPIVDLLAHAIAISV